MAYAGGTNRIDLTREVTLSASMVHLFTSEWNLDQLVMCGDTLFVS
jgi:hypothetical protein